MSVEGEGHGAFFCKWKIDNFTFAPEGGIISSPEFVTSKYDGDFTWRLIINLIQDVVVNVNGFHCYLVRVSDQIIRDLNDIPENYEISVLAGDKSYRRISQEMGVRRDQWPAGSEIVSESDFVDINEIMSLLKKNTLTICCRISSGGIFFPNQCLLRTRIGTQKRILKVSMPKDDMFYERQLFYPMLDSFPWIVEFSWVDEDLVGHVKAQQLNKQKVDCVVHVLDSSGNSVFSQGGRLQLGGQGLASWVFSPLLSRKWLSDHGDECLINGNLNMWVEIETSSASATHEVEKIYFEVNSTSFAEKLLDKSCSPPTSSLMSGLLDLYREKKFCDVTIQTERSSFPVHKTILCAQSPVFTAMFERDMEEKKTGVVKIPNLTDDTVQQMLLFMYTNTVEDLEFESALKLFSAADQYQMISLKLMCKNLMKVKLSVTNVVKALVMANFYDDDEWKLVVHQFILERDSEIIASELWKEFLQDRPQLAAETMHLIYLKKLKIYEKRFL